MLRDERRAFTVSSRWRIATAEMSEKDFASLKVNQDRLMEDIHHTCQWGTGERWGEYASAFRSSHNLHINNDSFVSCFLSDSSGFFPYPLNSVHTISLQYTIY